MSPVMGLPTKRVKRRTKDIDDAGPRGGSSWCSALNCSNNKRRNRDLSFFRFPKDDERSKIWVQNCQRSDLLERSAEHLFKNNKLCSIHFEDSEFFSILRRNRLNDGAVPTIFDGGESQTSSLIKQEILDASEACSRRTRLSLPRKKKGKTSIDTQSFEVYSVCDLAGTSSVVSRSSVSRKNRKKSDVYSTGKRKHTLNSQEIGAVNQEDISPPRKRTKRMSFSGIPSSAPVPGSIEKLDKSSWEGSTTCSGSVKDLEGIKNVLDTRNKSSSNLITLRAFPLNSRSPLQGFSLNAKAVHSMGTSKSTSSTLRIKMEPTEITTADGVTPPDSPAHPHTGPPSPPHSEADVLTSLNCAVSECSHPTETGVILSPEQKMHEVVGNSNDKAAYQMPTAVSSSVNQTSYKDEGNEVSPPTFLALPTDILNSGAVHLLTLNSGILQAIPGSDGVNERLPQGDGMVKTGAKKSRLFKPRKSGEEKTYSPTRAADDTKMQLRKRLKNSIGQIARLKRKLEVAHEKIRSNTLENIAKEHFEGPSRKFFLTQAKMHRVGKYGRRWSEDDKMFALSLYFQNIQIYSLLSEIFMLPSVRCLQLQIKKISLEPGPGFCHKILETLRIKAMKMPENERLCALLIDKVNLQPFLHYNQNTDAIVGLEHFGPFGQSKKVANQAVTFTIKGLKSKWKQMIGFFLSCNGITGDVLADILKDCITKLEECGFLVKVVIADVAAYIQKMIAVFHVSPNSPYINLFDHRILYMFYSSSLFKMVKDFFKKNDLLFEGNEVSWSHVNQFLQQDSLQSAKIVTKPNEVFSHSLVAGLLAYISLKALPSHAAHTAEFLERMQELHDLFSSQHTMVVNHLSKGAIIKKTNLTEILVNFRKFISSILSAESGTTPSFVEYWLVNINSLEILWDDLSTNHRFNVLLTSSLSREDVEHMFAAVHRKGNKPTCCQLKDVVKHAMIESLLSFSPAATCFQVSESLMAPELRSVHSSSSSDVVNTEADAQNDAVTDDSEITDEDTVSEGYDVIINSDECENSLPDSSYYYMCGYICKKFLSRHKCSHCKSELLTAEQAAHENMDLLLEFCTSAATGDKVPSRSTFAVSSKSFEFFHDCNLVFERVYDGFCHMRQLKHLIINSIKKEVNLDKVYFCSEASANMFLEKLVFYRVLIKLKFINRDLQKVGSALISEVGKKHRGPYKKRKYKLALGDKLEKAITELNIPDLSTIEVQDI